MTWLDYCRWLNSPLIIRKMPVLATRLSNSTAGSIFDPPTKKTLTLVPRSRTADKLATELRDLISVCRENLQNAQELQKQYYDKHAKPRSYTQGEKVLLNSKYITTRQNCKLEAKFFGLFRVLHPVRNQAYKLKLPKKWRIHNVFHTSLLE